MANRWYTETHDGLDIDNIVNKHTHTHSVGQDTAYSIAARLRAWKMWFESHKKKFFTSTQSSDRLWGQTRLLVNGHQISFLEINRPWREEDLEK